MARLQRVTPTGYRLLVVEDGDELRLSTCQLLQREGHEVRACANGSEAVRATRSWRPHVVVLDFVMPGMCAPEVVRSVREFDREAQFVLTTGYAQENPARDMMRTLDIQGYHDKSEGPEKLLLWVDAALKAYGQVKTINRRAAGFLRELHSSAATHRIQPINDLLETALQQMVRLTSRGRDTVAADRAGLLVTIESGDQRVIRARTGHLKSTRRYQDLSPDSRDLLDAAVRLNTVQIENGALAVPMQLGDRCSGAFLLALDQNAQVSADALRLFASQTAMALENVRLYQLATVDSLTGLCSRAQILKRLIDSLRLALRNRQPLSIILLDLDDLKTINDDLGHIAGDVALSSVGQSVRHAIRDTDTPGRYGGDEFLVIASATPPEGAARVAERLRSAIAGNALELNGHRVTTTASLSYGGFSTWLDGGRPRALATPAFWKRLASWLIDRVDEGMYAAKQAGRNCVHAAGEGGCLDAGLAHFLSTDAVGRTA